MVPEGDRAGQSIVTGGPPNPDPHCPPPEATVDAAPKRTRPLLGRQTAVARRLFPPFREIKALEAERFERPGPTLAESPSECNYLRAFLSAERHPLEPLAGIISCADNGAHREV
jgi:hypothetical protein